MGTEEQNGVPLRRGKDSRIYTWKAENVDQARGEGQGSHEEWRKSASSAPGLGSRRHVEDVPETVISLQLLLLVAS